MKIAVTYENGQIFQHFGHTAQFKLYEVENGEIISAEVVETNGSGHGALAGLLSALNVNVLICGGIGGGAQMALAQAGIKLFGGVHGDADEAVEAFLANNLYYDPEAKCDHTTITMAKATPAETTAAAATAVPTVVIKSIKTLLRCSVFYFIKGEIKGENRGHNKGYR